MRYLDDCYIKWKLRKSQTIACPSNHINPDIKFTIEHSAKQPAFLDILVKTNNDILTTDINNEAKDTRQYLDFTWNHPRHIKKNIPYNLSSGICTIVDDKETRDKRLQELSQILIKRGYPEKNNSNRPHKSS